MNGYVITILSLSAATAVSLYFLVKKWMECNDLVESLKERAEFESTESRFDALWREIDRLRDNKETDIVAFMKKPKKGRRNTNEPLF